MMTPPELIREFYERLTGKPCEVNVFVVVKGCYRGWWAVHVLGTCDFYEVHWKLNTPRDPTP